MSIKSNSKNTLNLTGIENAKYKLQSNTINVGLIENIITANKNADSKDSCEIEITGTYNEQNYTNHLIIYVEPKYTETREGQEYYRIYRTQDLVRLSELVNHNIGSIKNALMMNDIDLQGINWEPMGYWEGNNPNATASFKGIFDGQENIIKNMKINKLASNNSGVAFIGELDGGTIKNLKFDNPDIYSELGGTGVVVGGAYNNSVIQNVQVLNGKIESTAAAIGGICGESNSIIRQCSNNSKVKSSSDRIGGICGTNYIGGRIENCNNTGEIIGDNEVGGIAGRNNKSTIENCYNTGKIQGNTNVGDIYGFNIQI